MDTSARLPRWKRDAFRRSRWHHLAYCIFHIISIPLNCSDTALRVATIGAKVIILVFRYASRKPGWNFSYEAEAKFIPVTGPAQSTGLLWRGPGRVFHRIAPWNFMWDKFWPSVCAAQSRHSVSKTIEILRRTRYSHPEGRIGMWTTSTHQFKTKKH